MGIVVLGHFFGLFQCGGALLGILGTLYGAEFFQTKESFLRPFTKWSTFAVLGVFASALVSLLSPIRVPMPPAVLLGLTIFAGIPSGIAGGLVPNWVRNVARAKSSLEPTQKRFKELALLHERLEKEVRIAENAKVALRNQIDRVQAEIAELDRQIGNRKGWARRERERVDKERLVEELQKALARARKHARSAVNTREDNFRELGQCLSEIRFFEAINNSIQKSYTLRGTVQRWARVLPIYFAVGFIPTFILTRNVAEALFAALPLMTAGIVDLRIVQSVYMLLDVFSAPLNDFTDKPSWLSIKGFIMSFLALFLVELWVWISWTQLTPFQAVQIAATFGAASGIAGCVSVRLYQLVDNMTRQTFAKMGIILVIAGALLQLVQ